jgi:hypothetical protein
MSLGSYCMSLSVEERERRRAETLPAAKNLIDDLEFFREVFGHPTPRKRHIRQISVQLRRLLLDGQLKSVAAPRCGRLKLATPDNDQIFRDNLNKKVVAVGFSRMFDINTPMVNCMTRDEISSSNSANPMLWLLKGEKPTKLVTIDQFLSEIVLKYDGIDVNYGDIIKFICYHDFGAHATGKMNPKFQAIQQFRNAISVGIKNDKVEIIISDIDSLEQPGLILDYPQVILFSISAYIIKSDEICSLEDAIKSETV